LAMGDPKLNNILSNIFSDEITGGNTALSQGFFIVQLPLSVFVAGISMVSLPNMSKYFENGDIDNLKNLVLMGLRMVTFFTLPSVIGLMVLDHEIARFIYSDVLMIFSGGSRGKIDDVVIQNISLSQYFFAPGIISMGLSIIFIRAFQSMKDMKILILSGLASVALHLVLMKVFVDYFGWSFGGIALSITLSSFFDLSLLIVIFLKKLGRLPFKKTAISIFKMILSGIAMGAVILLFKQFVPNWKIIDIHYIDNIINTMILIISGMIVYLLTLLLVKEEEFHSIYRRVVDKFLPKKKN